MNDFYVKDKINLVAWAGNFIYLPDAEMLPVRQHQVIDEIKEFERELGGMVRFQKDQEGRYP
jgi:hypothetical protein